MNTHPAAMFEIMAIQPEFLRTFYSSVFGWTYQINAEGFAYIQFQDSPAIFRPALGGIGQADETIAGNRKGTAFYLQVSSIPETLRLVIAHGGAQIMPRTEANGYTFGMFTDPEHNLLGLIEPFVA
jgi:predicted enzyme related to lactoylglutathione lyase